MSERDVEEARTIRLDQERVDVAGSRIRIERSVADHHTNLARAAEARARQLAATWGLCATCGHSLGDFVTCQRCIEDVG